MPSDQRGDRSTAGEASGGASRVPDPVSPELVLVAPPEEASRARARLPGSPTAEWELLRSVARPRPAQKPPEPRPRPARRRRRWVRRTALAGVFGLVVVTAVTVGLAGSRRDTKPDRTTRLTLGPVRHGATTSTSTTPTTTTAKKPTHTKAEHSAPAVKPKAHGQPRAAPKKKPARKPHRKVAKKRTQPRRPPKPAFTGFVPARTWSWEPQARTRSYVFTLKRNGKHVITAHTAKPRYVLPVRFRFAAGRYNWRVVAVGARRKLVVDSRFRLSAAGAAAANR